MIREAADFATEAHKGMVRKGGGIPYIYHPMEVALLSSQMTEDEEVIAAAYLHDVLEDTSVTAEELKARFGDRVLALVLAETEDKSRTCLLYTSWHRIWPTVRCLPVQATQKKAQRLS